MTRETEIKNLTNHIPNHADYKNAKLQISIPTTSEIEASDALKLVHEVALDRGWKIDDITIIRKSGYIACKDCKKSLHIHISTGSKTMCMNCSGKNLTKTESEVEIIQND